MNTLRLLPRALGYGLIALLTLEGLARLEDLIRYQADFFRPYTMERIFRGSAQTGKEGIPDARFRKWAFNELGYRGPSLKGASEMVLFYGASETFGSTESEGKQYPQQFASMLDAKYPGKYDVVNAGIPGLRIGRLGYLDAAMTRTKAQHVVIYPSPANYIDTDEGYCNKPVSAQGSITSVTDHIRLFARSRDVVKAAIPPIALNGFHRLSIRLAERNTTVNTSVPKSWLDAFEKDLNCVVKRVTEAGAKPYLVTHATYFGQNGSVKNAELLTSWRSFYPSLSENAFIELEQKANAIVRQIASSNGLVLIPADQMLKGGADQFADFVHFTDKGANDMAALIFDSFVSAR
jgi:hypothetical protein